MFVIHCRKLAGTVWLEWFEIWRADEGGDTAGYLRELVEARREGVEYRMLFVLEE